MVCVCVCVLYSLWWGLGGPGGTSWLGSTGGSGVRQSNSSRLIRWTFLKFSTSCCDTKENTGIKSVTALFLFCPVCNQTDRKDSGEAVFFLLPHLAECFTSLQSHNVHLLMTNTSAPKPNPLGSLHTSTHSSREKLDRIRQKTNMNNFADRPYLQ